MDSHTICSHFLRSCDHAGHIQTLICCKDSRIDLIDICQCCNAFHIPSEECGNILIKMSERESLSDYMVPTLSKVPIYLETIQEIDTESSTIVTQTLAVDGFDGTREKDDQTYGLVRLPTSGRNISSRQLPPGIPMCKIKLTSEFDFWAEHRVNIMVAPLHQFAASPFNSIPLSPTFSDSSGQSLLFGISKISVLSNPPHEDGDDYRLEKSDFIRKELRKPVFPINEIHTLESLIDDLLDEGPSLEFEIITYARLDKIVEEILQHVRNNFLSQGPSFRRIMRKAQKLREQWIGTFGDRFNTMDDERLKFMKESGCLRDIELQPTSELSKLDGPTWKIKRAATFSEKEANENFEPGA